MRRTIPVSEIKPTCPCLSKSDPGAGLGTVFKRDFLKWHRYFPLKCHVTKVILYS